MPRSRNATITRLPVNPYLANALSFCVALLTALSPSASWTKDTVKAKHIRARRVFMGDAPPRHVGGSFRSCPRPRNYTSNSYFGGMPPPRTSEDWRSAWGGRPESPAMHSVVDVFGSLARGSMGSPICGCYHIFCSHSNLVLSDPDLCPPSEQS